MVTVEMLSLMKYDQKFEKLQVSSETLFKTCSNQQISGVKHYFLAHVDQQWWFILSQLICILPAPGGPHFY